MNDSAPKAQPDPQPTDEARPPKRPYETPKLTRIGTLRDLTFGAVGSTGESAVKRSAG